MNIALIAHDEKKDEMMGFTRAYAAFFKKKYIVCDRNDRTTNHGSNRLARPSL